MRKILPRTFTGTRESTPREYEKTHAKISQRAASEGIVLLKNDDKLLPLKISTPVALFGRGATQTVKGGTGSGEVNSRYEVSVFEGLKNARFRIVNEDYLRKYDRTYKQARSAWRKILMDKAAEYADGALFFENVYCTTPFVCPPEAPVEKFDADIAIYVLSRSAGEGLDRDAGKGDYMLSDEEETLLSDICRLYKQVIVILNVGGCVDLSFVDRYENIASLLLLSQAGSEGGNALAHVLSGKICPSGKLTDSWAYRYEDYPCSNSFSRLGNLYRQEYLEGIYVGYRWFDSFDIPVRYCFGHGLSYTSFEIKALSIDYENETVKIRAEVKNTGFIAGKEVVQLYASCPDGRLCKEYRRLVAYAKTKLLAPGESETFKISVPVRLLASYDEALPGWIMEKGNYILWLGSSLDTSTPFAKAILNEEAVLEKTRNLCAPSSLINEIQPENRKALPEINGLEINIPACSISCRNIEYEKTNMNTDEAEQIVNELNAEQLISMVCGDPYKSQTATEATDQLFVPGSAAETSSAALDNGVVSIVLADGPAGLRLSKFYDVENDRILPRGFLANIEDGALCPDNGVRGERYYQCCTAFPVGTLLAQTWDPYLQYEIGAAVAEEMSIFGVTLWLAPGMNIHRNPLCGRNFEYYSEDPLLSGSTAAAITQGVQSRPGCGVTIKHFAANNAEDKRMYSNSIMSERTLREIYLKGFEITVKKSTPMAIMSSYNLLNGIHTANSAELCTAIARDEWGFDGIIMTDWTVTINAENCSAACCIMAGNDLIMPGDKRDFENLSTSLNDGSLPLEKLRLCAARVIRAALKSARYE